MLIIKYKVLLNHHQQNQKNNSYLELFSASLTKSTVQYPLHSNTTVTRELNRLERLQGTVVHKGE